MKIVSLIPARAGSKRIPLKNIRGIGPHKHHLIYYAIEASKQCNLINETWVSTEDSQISSISKDYGSKVLDRPKELAKGSSTTESVMLHFAEHIDFDVIVLLQATSPLMTSKSIKGGVQMLLKDGYDSVLSVCKDDRFYWRKDGKTINYDLSNRPRSQDKEPWYKETGAFYITTKEALLKSKCRLSGKIGLFEVPFWQSFEIDTVEDWQFVDKLISCYADKLPLTRIS